MKKEQESKNIWEQSRQNSSVWAMGKAMNHYCWLSLNWLSWADKANTTEFNSYSLEENSTKTFVEHDTDIIFSKLKKKDVDKKVIAIVIKYAAGGELFKQI